MALPAELLAIIKLKNNEIPLILVHKTYGVLVRRSHQRHLLSTADCERLCSSSAREKNSKGKLFVDNYNNFKLYQ